MLTEDTLRRDALQALYTYCLHQVPGMSEYGDGAKEMRAARLALGIGLLVPLPVKPSAEAINHDLLAALKAAYVALSESDAWQDMGEEDDDLSVKIREAIAQAEGKI